MKFFFHKMIQTNSFIYYDGHFEKINKQNYYHYHQLKELYKDEYVSFETELFQQKIFHRNINKMILVHQELLSYLNSPHLLSFFQFI